MVTAVSPYRSADMSPFKRHLDRPEKTIRPARSRLRGRITARCGTCSDAIPSPGSVDSEAGPVDDAECPQAATLDLPIVERRPFGHRPRGLEISPVRLCGVRRAGVGASGDVPPQAPRPTSA